jgi:hypothetical protein
MSTLLLILSLMAQPAPSPPSSAGNAHARRPLPISAPNCYALDRTTNERLDEALALGIDNVEIDLGWDEAAGRLIVGHDAVPKPGVAYPEFESSLVPALEAHWRGRRADGAPTVLTIDWKTDHPDAVRRFKAFLDAHPDWFSSAPKAADSPLTARRLTVCLSGSDRAKDLYDSFVPEGGVYRAFRDTVFGAGDAYRAEVAEYVPTASTPYRRFLTFHWGHVERGGPGRAGDWTGDEASRLASLLDLAHRRGFRVRFYCLNGHKGVYPGPYRFADDDAARLRWDAAADAGADWVATDEYAEIVKELTTRGRKAPG